MMCPSYWLHNANKYSNFRGASSLVLGVTLMCSVTEYRQRLPSIFVTCPLLKYDRSVCLDDTVGAVKR
jgi:hypothetical protein